MSKVASQPGLAQDFACRSIDFANRRPRLHGFNRSLLRVPHSFIDAAGLARNVSHPDGTGLIGTITREYNTEVADHERAWRDGLLRGAAMRQCRSAPGRDDCGKRHFFSPTPASRQFHLGSDLYFLRARTQDFQGAVKDLCSQGNGLAYQLNLVRILNLACACGEWRSVLQRDAWGQELG